MPNLPSNTAYTPFPSHLLDTAMPMLKDTEWRLLCVVVRATWGWQDGERAGQRKGQDWLTHRQLKARTGRSSEAVCKALDALVRQGWLDVRDEEGNVLQTPQQRRSCKGRLYFQLGTAALPGQAVGERGSSPKEPDARAGRVSDAEQATVRSSRLAHSGESISVSETDRRKSETRVPQTETCVPQTETCVPQTETCVPQSEIRKAKTTKDIKDKTNPADTPKPDAISDVKRFLLAYQEGFCRRSGHHEPPPIAWGRDGKLAKGLLAQYGYTRLAELLDAFFRSEDAWAKRRGYALSCFPALLPSLLLQSAPDRRNGTYNGTEAAALSPLVIHGHDGAGWADAADVAQATGVAQASGSLFERQPGLARRVQGLPP